MSDQAKRYEEVGTQIGKLTQEKNEAYGDSFAKAGEILELLFPNGIQPAQYRDALGIVRVIDKLFRIATRKDAFGESPWRDIAGYGLLGAVADAEEQKPFEPKTVGPFGLDEKVRVLPPSMYAGMEGVVYDVHGVTTSVYFGDLGFIEFPNAYLEHA